MTEQKKYYSIRNKALANGLHWLTGERFIIFKTDKEGVFSYNFERTPALIEALDKMNSLKKEFQQ